MIRNNNNLNIMYKKTTSIFLVLIVAMALVSCGGSSEEAPAATPPADGEFSVYKAKEKVGPEGVGPIKNLEFGEIDNDLAIQGDTIFTAMCTSCHKMAKRHVGPALSGILERRNPAWVMNMILNPEVMVKEDPAAKKLFEEYLSPMANQNLTEEEARAVVEYFRKYSLDNPTN